jgi:integrase
MTLALNTAMRARELKGLRWREIDWIKKILTVNRSKTRAGERRIPLYHNALTVLLEIDEPLISYSDDGQARGAR